MTTKKVDVSVFRRTATARRPELVLTLDRREVFRGDPGAGTPEIVSAVSENVEYTASLDCAIEQGELFGEHDLFPLTPEEIKWLESHLTIADKFLYDN